MISSNITRAEMPLIPPPSNVTRELNVPFQNLKLHTKGEKPQSRGRGMASSSRIHCVQRLTQDTRVQNSEKHGQTVYTPDLVGQMAGAGFDGKSTIS